MVHVTLAPARPRLEAIALELQPVVDHLIRLDQEVRAIENSMVAVVMADAGPDHVAEGEDRVGDLLCAVIDEWPVLGVGHSMRAAAD